MTFVYKVRGEKCSLAPCRMEDAEKWEQWLNDPAITIPLGDEAYVVTGLESARESIAGIIRHQENVFTIVDNASEEAIGRCLLFGINQVDRCAMLGIFIGEPAYQGKGYGEEALCLLLDYAFNLLNLHNMMLGVFSFNERAIHVYQKIGFQVIGRRRQAREIGGVKYDAILMDLLASEFNQRHPSQFHV